MCKHIFSYNFRKNFFDECFILIFQRFILKEINCPAQIITMPSEVVSHSNQQSYGRVELLFNLCGHFINFEQVDETI